MTLKEKEINQILSDILEKRVFKGMDWDKVFDWDPGRKPEYPYRPGKVLVVEKVSGRWVPEWFPINHWTKTDEKGNPVQMTESERAFWFYSWLGREVRTDTRWKDLTREQKAMEVAEKMRLIMQLVAESWPEDWYRPKMLGVRVKKY